ncbi:MAG: RHS repeat-associated core domain-containing protein, partial [Gemmataceae bacterium]|nr:RHS repeat-associated core domain-containing protein [Gemmataceae bacterium]
MYDPNVGRWLQPDPIGFAGGDPNLYRYVGNSPTNFVDPSGLSGEPPLAGGGGNDTGGGGGG